MVVGAKVCELGILTSPLSKLAVCLTLCPIQLNKKRSLYVTIYSFNTLYSSLYFRGQKKPDELEAQISAARWTGD